MPYIKQEIRIRIEDSLVNLMSDLQDNGNKKGNLNYCVSRLIKEHLKDVGICYDSLSDITGVLNDIKTEFERKVVAPYEDKKIKENGEVYDK